MLGLQGLIGQASRRLWYEVCGKLDAVLWLAPAPRRYSVI